VASDIEPVREVIAQSSCALMVSPEQPHKLAEGIMALLGDSKKCNQMGAAGRNWAIFNYDRKKIINDMLTEILQQKEPGPF
jgi:glycosyltransferase involved in cell wall biosynthesis